MYMKLQKAKQAKRSKATERRTTIPHLPSVGQMGTAEEQYL